jgi:hypothetical protein
MESIQLYGAYDDDDEEEKGSSDATIAPALTTTGRSFDVVAAPLTVSIKPLNAPLSNKRSSQISSNDPVDIMFAPISGPSRLVDSAGNALISYAAPTTRRNGVGTVEAASVSDYSFNEQFKAFQSSGTAFNLETNEQIGRGGIMSSGARSKKKGAFETIYYAMKILI